MTFPKSSIKSSGQGVEIRHKHLNSRRKSSIINGYQSEGGLAAMKHANGINLTMLCDFYELTMGNGYFADGMKDRIAYFDIFFRDVPDGGGFAIAAGLDQIIDYVLNLHFSAEDIEYLRGRKLFSEEFLAYLANFRFTGDIWAVPEGTPVFPAASWVS